MKSLKKHKTTSNKWQDNTTCFYDRLFKQLAHNRKEVCDSNWSKSKEKEKVAKMIESIAKMGPFKTWILTPAFSVWIQFVSVTGMSVTGILLILYLFNFVAKFSKIPWNFFEMAFCCAMSFCYLTCGLHLFIKGSKIYVPSSLKNMLRY